MLCFLHVHLSHGTTICLAVAPNNLQELCSSGAGGKLVSAFVLASVLLHFATLLPIVTWAPTVLKSEGQSLIFRLRPSSFNGLLPPYIVCP